MATLLLAAAGSAIGGAFGPIGAALGQAAGAIAGNLIDEALLRRASPVQRGPRLNDAKIQGAAEGTPVPRAYGRVRLSGEMIWATEYEEVVRREESGGKGGPTVTNYAYYANFALGLCEGPIARVGRIWADGEEIDQTEITCRVHLGTETQEPDALILARQGGVAPAYRGLAYVVFERLPLEKYGNRIPQFSFEVVRVVEDLEGLIRGVCLIPGATEHGLGTAFVKRSPRAGTAEPENRHTLAAGTDLLASLDELQALAPNLESVAIVVSWFGTDLRAGTCRIEPRVESAAKRTAGATWSVAGLTRAEAAVVSTLAGRAAYGGTPSDASVVELVAELKARGLKVVLYPFVLMDVAPGNGLPDPYGGAEQAPFPWRGRIACHPAPGRSGSPDKTSAVLTQLAPFVGAAAPAHFAIGPGATVSYSGPAEWSFRRFVLHYAHLAAAAGGVDSFLIGSELVGLTTLRSSPSAYPFVDALASLAADVKAVLGPETKVTYGADWSEWSGHRPNDGTGDVHFHLDPLWASSHIDAVGIDWYAPLADWRDGHHLDAALAETVHDPLYLRANIAGGEDFDWFYADESDRQAQVRTPIADAAYGKDWVFRAKDLKSWWENLHYDRPGGVESADPTAWAPRAKPIWLVEIGCPAVDRGANEPNAFPDSHSSEGRRPRFSNGARDDLMQRRVLQAHLTHWDPAAPGHVAAANPTSPVYGGRMVPPDKLHLWAWDARPFPAFPGFSDVWADGDNWETGHWLNGRLGSASLRAIIRALLADYRVEGVEIGEIAGHIDGFVIDRPMSAREALEPLAAAFFFDCHDAGTALRVAGRARRPALALSGDDFVAGAEREADVALTRAQDSELPVEVRVAFQDGLGDYRRASVASRRLVGGSGRIAEAELAVAAPVSTMTGLAEIWLQDVWAARERASFALSPARLDIEAGDILEIATADFRHTGMVERIADGLSRRIATRTLDPTLYRPAPAPAPRRLGSAPPTFADPVVHVLDLPLFRETVPAHRPFLAVAAEPWPGGYALLRSASRESYSQVGTVRRPAIVGELLAPLPPGPLGRFDCGNAIEVRLVSGSLSARAEADILAGANRAAVRAADGRWEVLQFAEAELTGPDAWRLTRLLRGLFGTEDAWTSGMPAGAAFVVLDDGVVDLPIERSDVGREMAFRLVPLASVGIGAGPTDIAVLPEGRGLKPLSPVHLRARRNWPSGDIAVAWIRRTRIGGDSWGPGDVPLGESAELYRVEILDGTAVKRAAEIATPTFLYVAAQQAADFGALVSDLSVRLVQIGPDAGDGVAVEAVFHV